MRSPVSLLIAMLVAGLLASCGPSLPEDPDARLEAVRRHVEETRTGFQAGVWLAYLEDDVRPPVREYLLEVIRDSHEQTATFAIRLLDDRKWMEDEELRKSLRAYYLDPKRSQFRRAAIAFFLIQKWREYPEFADLPLEPPVPEGLVHVEVPQ